jgi:hypothetical protein
VNRMVATTSTAAPEPRIHNLIALEMVEFDPSEIGAARRCGLLSDFADLGSRQEGRLRKLHRSLDSASSALHGQPFCPGTDAP